jgi:hypothetical protein
VFSTFGGKLLIGREPGKFFDRFDPWVQQPAETKPAGGLECAPDADKLPEKFFFSHWSSANGCADPRQPRPEINRSHTHMRCSKMSRSNILWYFD